MLAAGVRPSFGRPASRLEGRLPPALVLLVSGFETPASGTPAGGGLLSPCCWSCFGFVAQTILAALFRSPPSLKGILALVPPAQGPARSPAVLRSKTEV